MVDPPAQLPPFAAAALVAGPRIDGEVPTPDPHDAAAAPPPPPHLTVAAVPAR